MSFYTVFSRLAAKDDEILLKGTALAESQVRRIVLEHIHMFLLFTCCTDTFAHVIRPNARQGRHNFFRLRAN